jgi:hypothetical protein
MDEITADVASSRHTYVTGSQPGGTVVEQQCLVPHDNYDHWHAKKRLYQQFPPLPGIQLGLQTHLAASTWFFVGSRLESTNNPLEPPAVGSEVTIGANDY